MTGQEKEIKRVISYIRLCREAGIDTTITIDKSRNHFILNALEEIQQYRAIGTVDECREAKERQRAKKPELYGDFEDGKLLCPNCDEDLMDLAECGFNCCPYCGQAISWEEE